MKRRFSAGARPKNHMYVAQHLDPDAVSQGNDGQEALENLREAIKLHFEPPSLALTPRVETIEVEVSTA